MANHPWHEMDRRAFLHDSGLLAAAAVTAGLALPSHAWAARRPSGRLKVGVIGCGGRGTGAGFSRRRLGVSKSAFTGAKVTTNEPGVCSAYPAITLRRRSEGSSRTMASRTGE